jgi:putative membrane protein
VATAGQKHIKDTLTVGSLSLLLSRIALPKLSYAMLKQFAQFEIAEQETVAYVLNAIKTNAELAGRSPLRTDAEVMQNLDDTLHAGLELDREYHRQQVERHQKLLEFQEGYLKTPTTPIRPMSPNWRGGSSRSTSLCDLQKLG